MDSQAPAGDNRRSTDLNKAVDEQSRQSAASKQAGAPCVYLKKGTCAEGSMRHDAHGHAPHLAASHAH
uniref:C3H1-type domain-containing protein n=1 Tax=Aegilops tauschii TaxID=37682 RepID=M8BUY4_AEGTA